MPEGTPYVLSNEERTSVLGALGMVATSEPVEQPNRAVMYSARPMRTIVIYHSNDFDGLFCREIARRALPEAELIGWDYGDGHPCPDITDDDRLYMLDISVDGLMDHPKLTWIDHHKTAIDKYANLRISGYYIDGVAACRLAYQFFFNEDRSFEPDCPLPSKQQYIDRAVKEPTAVMFAGEYDIWDKRHPEPDLFQHGLRSVDLSHSTNVDCLGVGTWWDALINYGTSAEAVSELLERGEAIQFYQAERDASIIKKSGFDVTFEGVQFLALNTPRCNSHAFEAGLKPHHDGCLGFWFNGKKWTVSLYGVPGKPDVDLSPIAVKYGGGGHKQACGFQTDDYEFQMAIGIPMDYI